MTDDFLDEIIRKERKKLELKWIKEQDTDLVEAKKTLDREFPGARFDATMLRMLDKKKYVKLFRKRLPVILIKFFVMAGCLLPFIFDYFVRLSFLDYATIFLGTAVFAIVPWSKAK
jgi:hypothetical protein